MNWKKIIGLDTSGRDVSTWSTALGPDFPESAGDREKGKFRESAYPRLTQIAVTNDDGTPIGAGVLSTEEETLLELKAIRIGIQLMLAEFNARSFSGVDLRELALGE